MGLTGSPDTFQSLMEQVLVGLTWKITVPYLDDCLIFFSTAEEHIQREVLQRFRSVNLRRNPRKCEMGFFMTVEKVRERFSWPGFQENIKLFINRCEQCQKIVS